MKILGLIFLFSLFTQVSVAANSSDTTKMVRYKDVQRFEFDTAAKFTDTVSFSRWVESRVIYPDALIGSNVSGAVVVSFKIEKDGSLSDVRGSYHPLLFEEAKRVILSSPKWNPASNNGTPLAMYGTVCVRFHPHQNNIDSLNSVEVPLINSETDPIFDGKATVRESNIAFKEWVEKRLRMPEELRDSDISRVVTVRFIITSDGAVTHVKELVSPHKAMTEEVKRVVLSSPRWRPATINRNNSSCFCTIRVEFTD